MVFVRRVHIFQSTRPSRGATTAFGHSSICRPSFQSTRPSRGATGDFSTIEDLLQFQSTRPSRGATQTGRLHKCPDNNFNPRAPRGARLRPADCINVQITISIHAPLAGRDGGASGVKFHFPDFNPRAPRGARPSGPSLTSPLDVKFQSTRPSRGATDCWSPQPVINKISIHAPLAGRDQRRGKAALRAFYFNPRAPRGARPSGPSLTSPLDVKFQSTRPSRGATDCWSPQPVINKISIHAPLAGRDQRRGKAALRAFYFNPRAPRGARRAAYVGAMCNQAISIHAPLAGRDKGVVVYNQKEGNFNPRAPRGARQQMCTKITYIFALTHKRNTFSCQTPSVRALSKKLSGRFSHKIRCEPPCKTMCAAAPHYTISVSSGRYVCLQPKCSILLSYFFPK